MSRILREAFGRRISRDQSRDTGMAMVLLMLIGSVVGGGRGWVIGAMAALVVTMTWPGVYRPVGVVWFGMAHLLGGVVSRVVLAVVFCVMVVPVGWVRRVMGKDALKLRVFGRGGGSVMVERNHTYRGEDLHKPY